MIQDTHWSSVELGPDPGLLTIQSTGWPSPGTSLPEWPNVGVGGSGQKVMWRSPKTICLLVGFSCTGSRATSCCLKGPALSRSDLSAVLIAQQPCEGRRPEPPHLDLYSQGTSPLIVPDSSKQEVRPNRKTQPQFACGLCTSCCFKSRLHSIGVRVCVRVY